MIFRKNYYAGDSRCNLDRKRMCLVRVYQNNFLLLNARIKNNLNYFETILRSPLEIQGLVRSYNVSREFSVRIGLDLLGR